jgi:hypothetical protein
MSDYRFNPPKKSIASILRSPVVFRNAGSILSQFFRKFALHGFGDKRQNRDDTTIDGEWKKLMNAYLRDPENKISPDRVSQSLARGNLQKELFSDTMTWKVFCTKALRFLQVVKFDMKITVYFRWRPEPVSYEYKDIYVSSSVRGEHNHEQHQRDHQQADN